MSRPLPWPGELRILLPEWIGEVVDPDQRCLTDEAMVELAIRLSRENVERGAGGPFGAAIFEADTGRLVGVGVNSVLRHNNSVLHAEMVAFMVAEARLGSFTLELPGGPDHVLATSCEPCAMCLGAVLWSGVRRVICGALRQDAHDLAFDEGPVFPESYAYLAERGVGVTFGVRRAEARAVMAAYQRQGGRVY